MAINTFDIRKESVLGKVFVGQVGLTSRSRTLTDEVVANHKMDRNSAAAVVVKLEAECRKEITQAQNQARALIESKSLPWSRTGFRLIPIKNLPELMVEMSKISNKFYDGVTNLLNNYDHLRTDYLRRVNDVADEIPFPTKEQIKSGFKFDFITMPLPNVEDIRLNHVSEEVVEEIRSSTVQGFNDRLQEAQSEIVERLIQLVLHVKDQCDKDPKETRFHKTLITNIEDAVEILPSLNITNDPKITKLIEKVRDNLTGIDVEDLKKDASYRSATVQIASSVLKDLKKYGN